MPPNVVFVLVDDLGWRDLGCQGSSFYETPTLDRVAREGMRFTDAYAAAPVCSPTRAAVMSGQYPARVGVTDWIDFWGETHPARGELVDAPYVDHLPAEVTSLAAALSAGGYDTWHLGKWHLGGEEYWPEEHGFDVNVGGCEWGAPDQGYFSPWGIPTLEDGPDGEYLTDRLAAEAAALVESHEGDAPFFMNLNFYSVHTPIQAPEERVAPYATKRAALGLDDVQEFEVDGRFPTAHKRNGRIERRLVQSNPTYAAMVESVDRAVGRLLDALDRSGHLEDTVLIFTSDNGGLATAEGSPTCNSPLSEGKGWMDEGGNRVPFIAWGPGVDSGVCTEPVTSPDVYPTVLDLAGVEAPADQAIDGESLTGLFAGEEALDREAVYWHYPHYGNQGGTPAAAVRRGDWKLVEFFEDDHVELYDLAADVREETDLSEHRPDLVADLRGDLADWRDEVGALLPEENPDFEDWPDRAGAGSR
jgi:arylsulfatase A-like enzyme